MRVISALLGLLVAASLAAPGGDVPYTLVYEQAFAAGNSLFSETDVYHYTSHGTESAVGPDPLYPDAYEAETVRVRTGRGPSGENVIDWYDSPTSGFDDYNGAGIWFRVPSVAAAGLTGIVEGAAEVAYRPNATSIADFASGPIFPLLYLNKYTSPGTSIGNDLFRLTMVMVSGVRKLQLQFFDYVDGSILVKTHTNAQPADTWWIYRVEFKEPTYAGSIPNGDGYIRVYENSVLVYEYTPARIKTNGQLPADRGLISGYVLGYAGLWGEATNVRIYQIDDEEPEEVEVPRPPTPIVNIPSATPGDCCSPAGATGSTTMVDTTVLMPAWLPSCDGGGAVPSALDVANSEIWDPQ
jgi:hypothetical protein